MQYPHVKLGDVCIEKRERILSTQISIEQYVTTDNMLKKCQGICRAESMPPYEVGLVQYSQGDILLSNIRPYLEKCWLADRNGGCSSDVIVFSPSTTKLSSSYLSKVLSQDRFFDYVMQNVSRTKMPRGKREWIKQFEFPLPPLPVQQEIVARLEKELAKIDEMAESFKRMAELADEEFKSVLSETFEQVEGKWL